MYKQWSELPAEQKADTPWGQGAYGGMEIRNRLQEGQSNRLAADIASLEKGFLNYPDELADVVYGAGWQQAVTDYRKERAVIEIIQIGSVFFLAGGGIVLAGGLTRAFILFLKKRASREVQMSDSEPKEADVPLVTTDIPEASPAPGDALGVPENGPVEKSETAKEESDSSKHKSRGYFQSYKTSKPKDKSAAAASRDTELPMRPAVSKGASFRKEPTDLYFGWAVENVDSTELGTLMTNEPLTKELTELTEEVSAIRQFAAQQQDQMRKLQDGYDWMIIRRFCLRIIRSVDNIDDRIELLQAQNPDASAYLEDIRDELIFALESSGVEQFRPDLKIPFKGLEKYAEAVRERELTEDPALVGCIARVARPGYQYLVNDDDVKIVRCAQVMLYETKQN
jgi:molecular chaperone GrpE (heat shock protein)